MGGQTALFALISDSKILFYCMVNHFFCNQNVVFWKAPTQLDTISLFNDRLVAHLVGSLLLLPVSLTTSSHAAWHFRKNQFLLSYSLDSKAIFIKYYLTWGRHSTALSGSMKSKLQTFLPWLNTVGQNKKKCYFLVASIWSFCLLSACLLSVQKR